MEIGWIDFSKTERDKVLSVFELLDEPGVLDELGISPIRDAFSDLFFPGTSTIQTRAKYFFIVPYTFRDLELNNQTDYLKLKNEFDAIEKNCAKALLDKNPDERGIIGKRAILNDKWVQRTPSSMYWAGLKKYGIIKYNISIEDCIKNIISQKLDKKNNKGLKNNVDKIEGSMDDKDAFSNNSLHLLNLPGYDKNWKENLEINLTYDEGQFLKNQIISACENSMLAYILKEDLYEILDCNSFSDLRLIMDMFPEKIQNDYYKALSFSEFVFVLRVIYNIIVSGEKNDKANNLLNDLYDDLKEISKVDIVDIMSSLDIRNDTLKNFLCRSKELMADENIEGLKSLIKSHEIYLKGINRSKTAHPGEYEIDAWFGGGMLDYRFFNAKNIIKDIYESENITEEVIEDVKS